jgi:hypothetical protein
MTTNLWKLTRLGCTLALGTVPMAFLAAPTPVVAQEPGYNDDSTYQGEAPERYAQVKRVEGDVRIRKGDFEETLDRGVPVAEGDTIVSRGRGVLQLGDGTRVAFGSGATFQVGALFTDSKGERQVLLRLDQGRIRIAMGGQSEARLRVDTPSGTAAMLDRGNATVLVEGDRSVRVRVHTGYLTFTTDQDQARINAGERLTIYSRTDRLNRVGSFNTYEADSFDLWCEKALETRRGASWDRVPSEIRYYSDDLDDNGEWVDIPDAGWCWRPRVTVVDWRPYWRGRWGAYSGGMTWVSDDPWGYVTHHYGRWGWHGSWGWYWIPGVFYSPAWVAWNWGSGYCGWAPLNYWNRPCNWGYGAWGGGYAWNVIQVNHINARGLHGHMRADRAIFASFSGGTGTTTWNPAWRRTPIIATQAEFRNPAQLGRAFDRQVAHDRMTAYERAAQASTGRGIIRRDSAGPSQGRGTPVPFEDRGRVRVADRPVLRDAPADRRGGPQPSPADRSRGAEPGRDRAPAPTERRADPAPRDRERVRDERGRDFFGEERRPADRPAPSERPRTDPPRRLERPSPSERPAPSERPRVDSPRRLERPSPSERPRPELPGREERPSPSERPRIDPPPRREERRPEPIRERAPEPPRERPSAPPPPPSRPSSPPPSQAPDRGDRGGGGNSRRG